MPRFHCMEYGFWRLGSKNHPIVWKGVGAGNALFGIGLVPVTVGVGLALVGTFKFCPLRIATSGQSPKLFVVVCSTPAQLSNTMPKPARSAVLSFRR